ncbi:MAG: hypothetical protein IJO48_00740 [Clostridia bacterium]|nr:hypothetical protein [Clostridia bacterium]
MDIILSSISEFFLGWSIPAIACLAAGLALVICEMFMPGFGITGILGTVALIFAVIFRAQTGPVEAVIVTIALILIFLLTAGFIIFRSLKKGRLSHSQIVLNDSITENATPIVNEDMQSLVGKEGICLNTLRPSGNADFDGLKLDVLSDGEFIKAGSKVRIVRVEGLKILVKEV